MLDFYRQNPVVTAVVLVLGIGLAVATTAFSTGGEILALAFALLVGLLVGVIVAVLQRRD